MAKKDRVYTKFLSGGFEVAASGVSDTAGTLVDSWVAQEDIEVIGWYHSVDSGYAGTGYPTADGCMEANSQLTFAAKQHQDSTFSQRRLKHVRAVFGSPASGDSQLVAHVEDTHMLPSGNFISMKEGEILNMLLWAQQDLGATVGFTAIAIIYYRKV